jgi:putative membrane protein
MVFTSPWDNYAVAKGIWDFPADRVWFRVRHLPIEEYAFFVIQSLLVIAFCIIFLQQSDVAERTDPAPPRTMLHWFAAALTMIVWAVVGGKGRGIHLRKPSAHYAWHLLYWFSPVVLLQWAVAGDIILGDHWKLVSTATLAIGTYLSLADLYAVRQGIWFFDRRQITGVYVAGVLPWEEIAFFYITSLVVAQSFVMLLPDSAR